MRMVLVAVAVGIVGAIAAVAFSNWIALEGRKDAAEYDH